MNQAPATPEGAAGAQASPAAALRPAARVTGVPSRLKYVIVVAFLFVVLAALVAGLFVAATSRMPPELRTVLREALLDDVGLLLFLGTLIVAALGLLVTPFFNGFVYRLARMAEETRVILAANPAHRVATDGFAEPAEIARLINALAERSEGLANAVDERIRTANARVDEERHRLAALMSELAESVLVCNREGVILLYNAAARALFSRAATNEGMPPGLVGLGRPVFGVLDRDQITHALDAVDERLRGGEARPVSQFVTTIASGRMIRVQLAPVAGAAESPGASAVTGYVLTLNDETGTIGGAVGRDQLIETLAADTRAGLASIRAAVESILEFETMEGAQRDRFTRIIRDEAVRLSERLGDTLARHSGVPRWPLQDMQVRELLHAIRRALERVAGGAVDVEATAADTWLSVDSFAVVEAFGFLGQRLREECAVRSFGLRATPAGKFMQLELRWEGDPIDTERAARWETQPLAAAAERGRLSLRSVAERHGGEQWLRTDRRSGRAGYSMLLPLAAAPAPREEAAEPARPEFYDFDLFHQPGQTRELEGARLAELAYTVFDCETTGLDPTAGDEIISISAVRIVNGRLLRQERFDQLVDPRRPVSPASIAIHGISPALLQGQPTIDRVLPRFARFAEDTVLVGHNVAFDMRFLQLKEAATGVRFIQPVLDTLLLSAVLHPALEEHALEANARRLGIPVIGRHTSLGDAIVTGEIFLRLVPLLAERGITTLKAAIEASAQTYLARIKY